MGQGLSTSPKGNNILPQIQKIARFFKEKTVRNNVNAGNGKPERRPIMAFFNSAIDILQTLVIAIGAGLGAWGVVNLLEGYGNDNPGANAHVR